MSLFLRSFIIFCSGFALQVFASDHLAQPNDGYYYGDEQSPPRSSQRLDISIAQQLFGTGRIPLISDVDKYYNHGHVSRACKASWSQMRHGRVRSQPIRASLSTLEARAKQAGLSVKKLRHTLGVFLENQKQIPEQRYISVVDFDKRGSQNRWFFIDLTTGQITSYKVSAGKGSVNQKTGMATRFSNKTGTKASSLGCAIAGGHYDGKHGDSIHIHGMESTNSNSCSRPLAVHQTKKYPAGTGRSNGCLAIAPRQRETIYNMLGSGGLVCILRDGLTTSQDVDSGRHHYVRRSHARRRSSYYYS